MNTAFSPSLTITQALFRLTLSVILLICMIPAYSQASRIAGEIPADGMPTIPLISVTLVDTASGDILPVRCRILDSTFHLRYPALYDCFFHNGFGGYFYSDSTFSVEVPAGETEIRIGYGFEYESIIDTVFVTADTNLVYSLERVADMRSEGWYGGDIHTHINHFPGYYFMEPEDARFIAMAEGLSLMNCLDNAYWFTGGPDPCSDSECVIYMTEEKRSGVWGHYALPGLESIVEPAGGDWGPLLMDIADSVHSQPGALVVASHPVSSEDFGQIIDWPGSGISRELPVDLVLGKVDAMEIMSYSNCAEGGIEMELWYRLLNCGFRLPCCAGTDACINQLGEMPPGGNRTYVSIPEGGFDYWSWHEGLAAGRSFVTNGPLFTDFKVMGLPPGDSVFVMKGWYIVPVEADVVSTQPLDRLEIVCNGEIVRRFFPAGDQRRISVYEYIRLDRSMWVAVRVYGRNGSWFNTADTLFAHTNPVYFDMEGTRIVDYESASYFVGWIDDLIALVAARGEWPDPADSVRAVSEFISARGFYEYLAGAASDAGDGKDAPAVPEALTLHSSPNPFTGSTFIRIGTGGRRYSAAPARSGIAPPEPHVEIAIYDVAGRLVRKLYRGTLPPGQTELRWDGTDDRGVLVASGVYFCVADHGTGRVSRKILMVR